MVTLMDTSETQQESFSHESWIVIGSTDGGFSIIIGLYFVHPSFSLQDSTCIAPATVGGMLGMYTALALAVCDSSLTGATQLCLPRAQLTIHYKCGA